MIVVSKQITIAGVFAGMLSIGASGVGEAAPIAPRARTAVAARMAHFLSLGTSFSLQTASSEVDWVDGFRPTAEQAMRDNARLGAQLRGGLLFAGRFKVGASLSYQGRLPKGEVGYGLVGFGVHLALQDDPSNGISWGGGVDVEKLVSTTGAVDASGGLRFFPHLVWDIFLPFGGPGNRHGMQLRVGIFFELGMDGPLMTEMSNGGVIRPQFELGWIWAGF